MDELDYVGARVSFAGLVGGLGGLLQAQLKGHAVPLRTAGLTALSCGVCGTLCFGMERLFGVLLERNKGEANSGLISALTPMQRHYVSHGVGGTVGGSLAGTLYIGRPVRGALFFTPLMLIVGKMELSWQAIKENAREQSDHSTR